MGLVIQLSFRFSTSYPTVLHTHKHRLNISRIMVLVGKGLNETEEEDDKENPEEKNDIKYEV